MIQYNRIETALTSLADSATKRIALRNETFVFSGLNSPYVSHRGCEITNGHGVPGVAVVENDGYAIVVTWTGNWVKFDPPADENPWRKLPGHLISSLFQFPAVAPKWVEGRVSVLAPDRFYGFDEGGSPIFRPCSRVTATWSSGMGEAGGNHKVLFTENLAEGYDTATGLQLFEGQLWDRNGFPLPDDCCTKLDAEPSDDFDYQLPDDVGMFAQCSRFGACPLEDQSRRYCPCPGSCEGVTKDWFFHPAPRE